MTVSKFTGSGKTTLLDVIACRTEGGLITGDVYLNNVARTSNMVRGCSAYVRQDDRLLPHLTVKETLMFVAHLKLPTTFSSKDIKKRVHKFTQKVQVAMDTLLMNKFETNFDEQTFNEQISIDIENNMLSKKKKRKGSLDFYWQLTSNWVILK